jgi:hypothetical protein
LTDAEFESEKRKVLESDDMPRHSSKESVQSGQPPIPPKSETAQQFVQNNMYIGKKANGAATAGLVLSLIGLLIIPFLFGLLGIIFSGVGLSRNREEYRGHGTATAGLIIGIIDILWGFIWINIIVDAF